jgi:NitT/TauT family transport system substrate-binding protein
MSRRTFLQQASALGAASVLGLRNESRAEPPPETTRLRLVAVPAICLAPQYLAQELLKAEGFTDIQYAKLKTPTMTSIVGSGDADLTMDFAGSIATRLDAGDPVVALAGVHLGCYGLFGSENIRTIRDLKGKTVAVWGQGTAEHIFLSAMAAYVGLDPRRDIRWFEWGRHAPVSVSVSEPIRLLAEGKVDAILAFPPEPQELRARGIGNLIVDTAVDRPWSQYFCCMVAGSREFVGKNPIAAKRAVRAILKAADICAQEPERVARFIVDKTFAPRYDYALQALKDVPYRAWRTYDPEDSLRFFALRLNEVGMIKTDPKKLIAQGTDWRFLDELKKEMKA